LSMASTSNLVHYEPNLVGVLELCSRLGLEASRATGFKRET
jgi:hypothetical protein